MRTLHIGNNLVSVLALFRCSYLKIRSVVSLQSARDGLGISKTRDYSFYWNACPLAGRIPMQLGSMKSLEQLDLSYNMLDGECFAGGCTCSHSRDARG